MIKMIGKETKNVYVKGKTRAECFRKLQEKYPYYVEDENHTHGKQTITIVYPEPLLVVRM